MLFKAGPYISASQSRESTKDQEGAVRDVEGGLYKTILPPRILKSLTKLQPPQKIKIKRDITCKRDPLRDVHPKGRRQILGCGLLVHRAVAARHLQPVGDLHPLIDGFGEEQVTAGSVQSPERPHLLGFPQLAASTCPRPRGMNRRGLGLKKGERGERKQQAFKTGTHTGTRLCNNHCKAAKHGQRQR